MHMPGQSPRHVAMQSQEGTRPLYCPSASGPVVGPSVLASVGHSSLRNALPNSTCNLDCSASAAPWSSMAGTSLPGRESAARDAQMLRTSCFPSFISAYCRLCRQRLRHQPCGQRQKRRAKSLDCPMCYSVTDAQSSKNKGDVQRIHAAELVEIGLHSLIHRMESGPPRT